jgi:hypothetical protein
MLRKDESMSNCRRRSGVRSGSFKSGHDIHGDEDSRLQPRGSNALGEQDVPYGTYARQSANARERL